MGKLTAYVVGPPDDTDGVEAAGAAGLVPVHPAVGHAGPRLDCWGEGGGDVGGREVLDGRGDREACEEGGEVQHDDGADGRHRDLSRVLYQRGCISVCCKTGGF